MRLLGRVVARGAGAVLRFRKSLSDDEHPRQPRGSSQGGRFAPSRRHPLDGYDYTADVPAGTPLLVQDDAGRVWRLARRGVRYHSDVRTRLHGARPARAPKEFAASQELREIIAAVLRNGTQEPGSRAGTPETQAALPEDAHEVTARWSDQQPGSHASRPYLEIRGTILRAVQPNYDDAPTMAWRRATAAELRRVQRALAITPRGVHLPRVQIRERHVQIRGDDDRAALAATIPGATPTRATRIYRIEPGYAEALGRPDARLTFDGGPVEIPEPGTAWRVPITAWRAATTEGEKK